MLNRSLLVALLALVPTVATAQDSTETKVVVKPWNALPANTILAVEFQDLGGLLERLRATTKLGQVVLSEARIQKFVDVIKRESGGGADSMVEELAKYGLSFEDFVEMAKGSGGMALQMHSREGEYGPLFALTMWVECDAERQARLLTALGRSLEEEADGEHPPRRIDLEIAGSPVTRISQDMTETDWSAEPNEDGEYPEYVRGRMHAFLARTPSHLIYTMNLPSAEDQIRRMRREGKTVDLEALSGAGLIENGLGRFLTHLGSGDAEGFAAKASAVKGLMASRPAGQTFMRAVALPRQVMSSFIAQSDPDDRKAMQVLALDQLGALGMFMTLDGTVMRTSAFMESRGERRGLFKILDFPQSPMSVPDWVPASALGYSQFGLDVARLYQTIKDIAMEVDPAVGGQFGQIEAAAPAFLGVELNAILTSLGKSHSMLTYEPRVPSNVPPEMALDVPGERMAFALPVSDPAPWKSMLEGAKQNFGAQGGMEFFDGERGFTGMRVPGPMPVEIYLGHGHLLFAFGEGVGLDASSALVKTPEGDQAFKNSPLMTRAASVINWREGFLHQVADNAKLFDSTMRQVKAVMEMAGGEEMAAIFEALPSIEEMKGVFGLAVSQGYTNEDGFIIESHQVLGGK